MPPTASPLICIGITGPLRAGKNTIARILGALFPDDAAIVETSRILENILRDIFQGTGILIDVTRRDLKQNTFSALKKYLPHGHYWLSDTLRKQWIESRKILWIFNGVLMRSDLKLVQSYPQHLILFADASFETRLRRAHEAEEAKGDERGINEEEFRKKHHHETARFVESIKLRAKDPKQKVVIVENNTDDPRRLGNQIITALLNTYLFTPADLESRRPALEALYQELTPR